MSAINIASVNVLDNPTLFQNPLQLEIQYECLYPLQHGECDTKLTASCQQQFACWSGADVSLPADLEWKLIYVGSPESEKYDQVLDSVLVGPVAPGSYRFVFQVNWNKQFNQRLWQLRHCCDSHTT